MCLVTLAIWLVLSLGVIVSAAIVHDDQVTVLAVLVALGLGLVLPIAISYWRPLLYGWQRRRQRLHNRLLADGVLTTEDLQKGAHLVRMWEVRLGTERRLPKTTQHAFLILDDHVMNVLGERMCFRASRFHVIPTCTGRCSRCWVIWACGGDGFRLRATVDGRERDFIMECREGRTLRQAARATEMLEELVEMDASARAEPSASSSQTQ